MAAVFGPKRLPLGHPETTRLIQRLWPDEVAERTIRETNEAILLRHVREGFLRGTESAWTADPVDPRRV